jgi:cellulose biosynthesis protein BcsQ
VSIGLPIQPKSSGRYRALEAEGIWLAIIDTAGTNNALAMSAIASADLCLIPARPSPADTEATDVGRNSSAKPPIRLCP